MVVLFCAAYLPKVKAIGVYVLTTDAVYALLSKLFLDKIRLKNSLRLNSC